MELSSSQLELDQRYCREAMEIWTPYSLVYIICVTELSTRRERSPNTMFKDEHRTGPQVSCGPLNKVANYRGISIVRVLL